MHSMQAQQVTLCTVGNIMHRRYIVYSRLCTVANIMYSMQVQQVTLCKVGTLCPVCKRLCALTQYLHSAFSRGSELETLRFVNKDHLCVLERYVERQNKPFLNLLFSFLIQLNVRSWSMVAALPSFIIYLFIRCHLITIKCGKSYKHSTIINYYGRVVI